MCKVITAKKVSPTPATETVIFNKREERRESGIAEFKVRAYTVEAAFTAPPCPALVLEAQAKAGLPFDRHSIYPETLQGQMAGGVYVARWKCRA